MRPTGSTRRSSWPVSGAAVAGGDWQERPRDALLALLRYLGEHPALAHLAVIEVLAAGTEALAERDQALMRLSSLIGDEALEIAPDPAPRLLLDMIAGAILQLVYARVLVGASEQPEELLPTIMYLVLVPLHGQAGAAARAGLLPADAARD